MFYVAQPNLRGRRLVIEQQDRNLGWLHACVSGDRAVSKGTGDMVHMTCWGGGCETQTGT